MQWRRRGPRGRWRPAHVIGARRTSTGSLRRAISRGHRSCWWCGATPSTRTWCSTSGASIASAGGACRGCRAGSAPALFFFAQLAKHRRIFPESPRCWGRAKTHDRAIVRSRISAARSRLWMIRLRFTSTRRRLLEPTPDCTLSLSPADSPRRSPPDAYPSSARAVDSPGHCLSAPESRQTPGMRVDPDVIAGRPLAGRCAGSEPDRRELR